METHDIKRSTFWSIVWMLISACWASIASFAVFLVLARILNPHVFGVYGLAAVLFQVVHSLANGGFNDAIIRQNEITEALADSIFWANLAFSILATLAIVLFAGMYAQLFKEPEVSSVLVWLALTLPIEALASVHTARLFREFGHKMISIRVMVASLVGGAAAVGAAISGAGVWSLVLQAWIVSSLTLVFSWHALRWVPQPRFSWKLLREVLGYSANVIARRMLLTLLERVQDVFIGSSLGASAVGNYRIARRTIELIVQIVLQPVGYVALTTLSRLQDDSAKFRAAYCRLLGLSSLATFPVFFGVGALSDELVHLSFGQKWIVSAAVIKVLALLVVPLTFTYIAVAALSARGAARAVTIMCAAQLAVTVVLYFLTVPFGLLAVAAAYVLSGYLIIPYVQRVLRTRSNISVGEQVAVVRLPFLASLCMVGLIIVTAPMVHVLFKTEITFCAAQALIGGITYLSILVLFGRALIISHLRALEPVIASLNDQMWHRAYGKLMSMLGTVG